MLLFLIFCLLPFAIANPLKESGVVGSIEDDQATYYNAVDFAQPVAQAQLSKLQSYGYKTIFVRGYNPAGTGGSFDTNSSVTIKNANLIGMVTEVYITPNVKSSKTGALQVEETYNGLLFNGITGTTNMWLQVVDENQWNSVQNNINFIQSAITRMPQLGLKGGIYTTREDWHYITMDWTGASNLMLWYSNTSVSGLTGESPANFDDFIPFGGWTKPVVKQYGKTETVVIFPLNRNVLVIDALPTN